jgi:hypothetical protein
MATFRHDGKISPAWRGWGCTPTPFHYIYISISTYKVVVYAPAESPPVSTVPLHVLCDYNIVRDGYIESTVLLCPSKIFRHRNIKKSLPCYEIFNAKKLCF